MPQTLFALMHRDFESGKSVLLRMYVTEESAQRDKRMIERIPYVFGEFVIEEVELEVSEF